MLSHSVKMLRPCLYDARHATLARTCLPMTSASIMPIQQRHFSMFSFGRNYPSQRIGKNYRNYAFAIIVPEQYAIMVHRFKRYHKQLDSGLNFIVPFIDTVEYVHDMREQAIDISS